MATKHPRPRYALGFLFVALVVLIPLKLFESQVIRVLSPYMGGASVCPGGQPQQRVTAFGPKDSCFHISQSADNLVSNIELGLAIAAIILVIYILFRAVLRVIIAR